MDPELRREIDAADWDDVVRRALAYTGAQLASPSRRHLRPRVSHTPDQYVQRAVFRMLNEEIGYPGGGLFPFICGLIRDLIVKDFGR